MTKISILILLPALLVCCGIKRSDLEKVKSENDSLVQLLANNDSNVRIKNSEVMPLPSKYTGETYDLYISYPADYRNSGKTYPVLVVLDAEVNFGAVSYISQRLIRDELIPELIIVGIAYKGETDDDTYYSIRARDFTPASDTVQENRQKNRYQLGTGEAENFVKFLSLELYPYLADHYPIDNKSRTIYGHSFGGLFGTHLLVNHPTLFDNYLILSPSLWWAERAALKDLEAHPSISSKKVKIYMGTGALEGVMVDDQLKMAAILKKNNPEISNIKSEILDRETHRTVFGRGFTNGLRFLLHRD
jgi:predicted alpha/beta superfamily hydrolase